MRRDSFSNNNTLKFFPFYLSYFSNFALKFMPNQIRFWVESFPFLWKSTLPSLTLLSLHFSTFFHFYFILLLLNSFKTIFLKSHVEKKCLYYRGTKRVWERGKYSGRSVSGLWVHIINVCMIIIYWKLSIFTFCLVLGTTQTGITCILFWDEGNNT